MRGRPHSGIQVNFQTTGLQNGIGIDRRPINQYALKYFECRVREYPRRRGRPAGLGRYYGNPSPPRGIYSPFQRLGIPAGRSGTIFGTQGAAALNHFHLQSTSRTHAKGLLFCRSGRTVMRCLHIWPNPVFSIYLCFGLWRFWV